MSLKTRPGAHIVNTVPYSKIGSLYLRFTVQCNLSYPDLSYPDSWLIELQKWLLY